MTLDRIRAERVVAILRRVPEPETVVDALVAAGIGIVEITLDSDGALATIERLRARGEVTVLAGTVRTPEEAAAAAAAGAEACVAPTLVPAMVERCRELGLAAIPGALTPSELEAAKALGVKLIKLFPASLGGPGYVREVVAPLAGVQLIVTGGVDASNAGDFLAAGAVAVGVGSSLTGADDLDAEARRLVAAVSPSRPGRPRRRRR
jgi:2-dehydro-3-deoxyphosphogluconate aldolase / (4S)-4-hydroxy-2-oxoglutarate aldolase